MAKKTAEDRRREANAQGKRVTIGSGGPGHLIATYPGTSMRDKAHANNVAKALRAKGWTVVVDKDNTVTATAGYDK